MPYKLIYTKETAPIPREAAGIIPRASENDLRVLLALALSGGGDSDTVSASAGLSVPETESSLSFWRGAGIVRAEKEEKRVKTEMTEEKAKVTVSAPTVEPQSYTSEDVKRICRDDPEFKALCDECMKILGKVFTFAETNVLLYLYDHLKLDSEYLLMLFTYCAKIKFGTFRYIEKIAIGLYDEGIVTVSALDTRIQAESRKRETEYKIRALFGIGERALTPRERECVDAWSSKYMLPYEVIELGYYKMIDTKKDKRPSVVYEDKILQAWSEAGLRSAAQVKEFLESEKGKTTAADGGTGKDESFDKNAFFELACKRGKESSEKKD